MCPFYFIELLQLIFLNLIDRTKTVTADALNHPVGHGLVRQHEQPLFAWELLSDGVVVAEQNFLSEQVVGTARLEAKVDCWINVQLYMIEERIKDLEALVDEENKKQNIAVQSWAPTTPKRFKIIETEFKNANPDSSTRRPSKSLMGR